jgi:hypothetical protein
MESLLAFTGESSRGILGVDRALCTVSILQKIGSFTDTTFIIYISITFLTYTFLQFYLVLLIYATQEDTTVAIPECSILAPTTQTSFKLYVAGVALACSISLGSTVIWTLTSFHAHPVAHHISRYADTGCALELHVLATGKGDLHTLAIEHGKAGITVAVSIEGSTVGRAGVNGDTVALWVGRKVI